MFTSPRLLIGFKKVHCKFETKLFQKTFKKVLFRAQTFKGFLKIARRKETETFQKDFKIKGCSAPRLKTKGL